MKPVFDHRMFRHINESARRERGRASRAMELAEAMLQRRLIALPLALVEWVAGMLLTLPVPELKEFSYIDKNVIIMSRTAKVGRRVHIAPRVFVSGGGDFEIEDYACIATNSNIITSTEILKDGTRCSGPMVSAAQRNVHRGKVLIKKDAFIGANATLLPGVTVAEGSVAGAGVTIAKDTMSWGIYVGAKTQQLGQREPVKWPDD
jgi:acetyltransferase-like isoleucine patch superfamily enzyme